MNSRAHSIHSRDNTRRQVMRYAQLGESEGDHLADEQAGRDSDHTR